MISHPPNEDSLMDYTGYDCFLTKYIFLSQCDTRLKLNEICSIYDICEELFYGDVDPLSWGVGWLTRTFFVHNWKSCIICVLETNITWAV